MSNEQVRKREVELGAYTIGTQERLRAAVLTVGCAKLKEILEMVADHSGDELVCRQIAIGAAEAGNLNKAESRTTSAAFARRAKLNTALNAAEHFSALMRFALRGAAMGGDECDSGLMPSDHEWLAAIVRGEL